MLQSTAESFQTRPFVSACSSSSWFNVADSHTSNADAKYLNPMQSPSILHLSFNQDAGCFSVGTTNGFVLFNTDPFGESLRRSSGLSGFCVVQMLLRTNVLALVGTDGSSRNKVLIWDDRLSRCIHELLFRSEVKTVRLRRDRIVVVLLQKIYVYNFLSYKFIHQIETQENPQGMCEISQSTAPMVLVCLGLQRGFVRVEQYETKQRKHVMAHNSDVASIALMHDGRLMATASSKGTLVRVFSTTDGSLLKELRRGSERAVIFSLCFSVDAQWLAVSSDKGTVHVFSLKVESAETNKLAPHWASRLSFIKGVMPKYFSSEWSMAQFRVQEGLRHIVGFGQQENTIIIIGYDGSSYRCKFDPVLGGEMTQLECHNF